MAAALASRGGCSHEVNGVLVSSLTRSVCERRPQSAAGRSPPHQAGRAARRWPRRVALRLSPPRIARQIQKNRQSLVRRADIGRCGWCRFCLVVGVVLRGVGLPPPNTDERLWQQRCTAVQVDADTSRCDAAPGPVLPLCGADRQAGRQVPSLARPDNHCRPVWRVYLFGPAVAAAELN